MKRNNASITKEMEFYNYFCKFEDAEKSVNDMKKFANKYGVNFCNFAKSRGVVGRSGNFYILSDSYVEKEGDYGLRFMNFKSKKEFFELLENVLEKVKSHRNKCYHFKFDKLCVSFELQYEENDTTTFYDFAIFFKKEEEEE